jgi:hypothetical protein
MTYLNGIVHSYRKTEKVFFWQLEVFDVCTTGGKNLNIVSMCAVSPVVNTSNIFICQKNFFSFPVAVNSSIKVGPFVSLL